MLKAIGLSVSPIGLSDTIHAPPANAVVPWTSPSTSRPALANALQRLANVRVDRLPIVDERHPDAFVGHRAAPMHRRLATRMRRGRSVRGSPADERRYGLRHLHGNDAHRRLSRHVPTRTTVGAPDVDVSDRRDTVSSTALPAFTVTASFSLRSLEQALSRCARPVSGLIRDAQMLYAVASDHTLSDKARRYLQRAGQVIDIVTGFHPTLGLVQGVCGLGARGLEILQGSPATEDDLTNVTLMMKAATRHQNEGGLLHDDGAFDGPNSKLPPRAHARDSASLRAAPQAEEHDVPEAAQTFELHYAEQGEAELDAVEDDVISIAEREHGVEDSQHGEEEGSRDGVEDSQHGVEGSEHGVEEGSRARVEGSEHVGDDREVLASHDVATISKDIDTKRVPPVGTTSSQYPHPPSSAVIDAVPIIFSPSHNQQPGRWQRMPLLAYVEAVRCPRGGKDGQIFRVDGEDYIQFDGLAHPFYAALPGSEFIYSKTNDRLPPLPLEKHGSVRVLKAPRLMPVKKIPIFPGEDGFIRIHNKRYVVFGQIVVEAERPQLIGEVQFDQNAIFIDAVLSAPDAAGVIHADTGTQVIEGGRGYYRVKVLAASNEVELLDPQGEPVNVRLKYDPAMRRWSISSNLRDAPLIRQASQDSLNTYQEKLTWSPFLRQRPRLQKAMSAVLDQLGIYNLYRPNRLSPHDSGGHWITDIYEVRETISRTLQEQPRWEDLTVKERQGLASKATWSFFSEHAYWGSPAGSQAFCSEMLDIAFSLMSASAIDSQHFLQIVFQELPGSGRSHVAMLYADNPVVFKKFGNIDMPASDATLQSVDHEAFADWLLAHRETVAIIDPWGPEKLNDLSLSSDRSDVELRLNVNLREAKFNMDGPVRYRVGALVPTRELRADQRLAVAASKDVRGDQKALCALLDSCLR